MHSLINPWYKFWFWLLANSASRATVILVFITAWYTILTRSMAKAIARQTRAMVQPVALVEFHWNNAKYHPVSSFELKNLGAQPMLLLDVKLWCGVDAGRRHFTHHYTILDEHIIPPGESLNPKFDFRTDIEREQLRWTPDILSYS